MGDQISDAIKRAQEKREAEIEIPGTGSAPLLGECPKNAIALAEELTAEGFAADIAAGAFEIPREPTPESFRDAQRRGQHHFWVILDTGQHVDLCSELRGREGDSFVRPTLPSEYVLFGRIPYKRSLSASTLNDPNLLDSNG